MLTSKQRRGKHVSGPVSRSGQSERYWFQQIHAQSSPSGCGPATMHTHVLERAYTPLDRKVKEEIVHALPPSWPPALLNGSFVLYFTQFQPRAVSWIRAGNVWFASFLLKLMALSL